MDEAPSEKEGRDTAEAVDKFLKREPRSSDSPKEGFVFPTMDEEIWQSYKKLGVALEKLGILEPMSDDDVKRNTGVREGWLSGVDFGEHANSVPQIKFPGEKHDDNDEEADDLEEMLNDALYYNETEKFPYWQEKPDNVLTNLPEQFRDGFHVFAGLGTITIRWNNSANEYESITLQPNSLLAVDTYSHQISKRDHSGDNQLVTNIVIHDGFWFDNPLGKIIGIDEMGVSLFPEVAGLQEVPGKKFEEEKKRLSEVVTTFEQAAAKIS